MSANLLKKISGTWHTKKETVEVDGRYAGDHLFYPTMDALKKASIKNGAVAMQTRLGYWVRKEDHYDRG